MYENYYAVIMAGGGGTRLWPLSRKKRPKQMLSLVEEQSLFQMAVGRLERVFSPDRVYIVTVQDQAAALQEQCPEIPPENYLLETMPRGTASVVGLAATALRERDPEAVMAVLTADHIIKNQALFNQILKSAYEVSQEDYLVTLGIHPSYPATGYGYIHRGSSIGSFQDLQAFQVLNFTEKPAAAEAETMLNSGEYSWNSGMFFWRVEVIMDEIYRQMPSLASHLEVIANAWGTDDQMAVIQDVWPKIVPETIDYGIMENAERVAVIPAEGLEWSDVGSWDALYEILQGDSSGNILYGGELIALDSQGTLIYTAENPRTVVTIGTEDLIVVDTGDVLLVCPREYSQKVRDLVRRLEEENRSDLL